MTSLVTASRPLSRRHVPRHDVPRSPLDQCRERAGRRRRPFCSDGRRPAGPNLRLTLHTESRDTAQRGAGERGTVRCVCRDQRAVLHGGAIRVSTGHFDQYPSPSGRHGPAAGRRGVYGCICHVRYHVTYAPLSLFVSLSLPYSLPAPPPPPLPPSLSLFLSCLSPTLSLARNGGANAPARRC